MKELIKSLKDSDPNLNARNLKHSPDPRFGYRIRFYPDSMIDSEHSLRTLLSNCGVTEVVSAKASGSPLYDGRGYKGQWQGQDVYFLLNSVDRASGVYPRKTFSPEKLGLGGQVYHLHSDLLATILNGIGNLSIVSDEHKAVMKDLVMSFEEDRQFTINPILLDNKERNKIESDLGESLAALHASSNESTIAFVNTINNALVDFYEDGVPVSVKSSMGGQVNLSKFASIIPKNTPVERVFWACGNWDKEELFKASSESCSFILELAEWVGGTSENSVAKFIKQTDYDVFYNWIDSHPKNLNHWGVPEGEKAAREYWTNGDTHNKCPFYFTLCTLIQQVWAEENAEEVSSVLANILTGCKFYDVKIDLNTQRVIIAEQKFADVNSWTFCYWSRATAAFHNWPGAARKKK